MRLARTSETYDPSENRTWLASLNGFTDTFGVTLDGDFWSAVFTDGTVPSGVVVAIDSVSGLGVPYDDAYDADTATTGQQAQGHDVAVGHLLTTLTGVDAGARVSGALVDHVRVNRNLLPTNAGLDAAAEADLSRCVYRNA